MALTDGIRSSEQSWKELLLDLKQRGLNVDPIAKLLETGHWASSQGIAGQVFGNTRGQRCWVHKSANVLNKLPKHLHATAKSDLQQIWTSGHARKRLSGLLSIRANLRAKIPEGGRVPE